MGLTADTLVRGRIRTFSSSSTTPRFADRDLDDTVDVIHTSSGGKHGDGGVVKLTDDRRVVLRRKIIRTSILYSGVFFLGLQWGVIGPSLPDLEHLTSGSTTLIALILTGRNIASLAGSAVAGLMTDKYNNWILLGTAEIFLGVMFAVAPCSHKLVVLALCLIPSGIAAGFYDTGVNVAVLNVWIRKPGPWIQAMECIDAIGSFVAPLLARPFLLRKSTNQLQGITRTTQSQLSSDYYNNNNNNSLLANALSVSPVYIANGSSTVEAHEESSIVYFAYLVVGLLLVIVGAAHLLVFTNEGCQIRIKDTPSTEKIPEFAPSMSSDDKKIRLALMPLLFSICFAYYALETGYAHYLMTFCVKQLLWSKDRGVALTSVFWAAYTTGTAVGILVVKYTKPQSLLMCNVTACLLSQVVLTFFVFVHPAIIWCCTIVTGISISTIFSSVFSWTESNIGVSGKVNALLMVGMASGEMTSPALIGILIDRSGATSWLYCMLASALLCVLAFLLMHVLANKLKEAKCVSLSIRASLVGDVKQESGKEGKTDVEAKLPASSVDLS